MTHGTRRATSPGPAGHPGRSLREQLRQCRRHGVGRGRALEAVPVHKQRQGLEPLPTEVVHHNDSVRRAVPAAPPRLAALSGHAAVSEVHSGGTRRRGCGGHRGRRRSGASSKHRLPDRASRRPTSTAPPLAGGRGTWRWLVTLGSRLPNGCLPPRRLPPGCGRASSSCGRGTAYGRHRRGGGHRAQRSPRTAATGKRLQANLAVRRDSKPRAASVAGSPGWR